jgi:hypothetical protein
LYYEREAMDESNPEDFTSAVLALRSVVDDLCAEPGKKLSREEAIRLAEAMNGVWPRTSVTETYSERAEKITLAFIGFLVGIVAFAIFSNLFKSQEPVCISPRLAYNECGTAVG